MPERKTIRRAERDKRKGKSASTQAGEFVREEIHHVREGKHGARSAKQAIAIGLSKARRAGVDLPPPRRGTTSEATRRQAEREHERAQGRAPPGEGIPAASSCGTYGARARRKGIRDTHGVVTTGARRGTAEDQEGALRSGTPRGAHQGTRSATSCGEASGQDSKSSRFAEEESNGTMRILLAIDGSPFSEAATKMLIERPWPPGSVVRVLSVVQDVFPVSPAAPVGVPLVTEPPINYEDLLRPRVEEAERLIAETAQALGAANLHVETAMRRGDPRREVVEEATEWNADLIVVGSHGRTGVERWLMGSVSEGVMRHAPCSVEVVRSKRAEVV